MRSRLLLVTLCLVISACDQDPARSLKIVNRPATVTRPPDTPPVAEAPAPRQEPSRPTDDIVRPSASSTRPKASQVVAKSSSDHSEWRPSGCPPPPEEGSGSSSLKITGPCTFEHRGAVSCEVTPDDFLLTMSRKGARGATLMVFINVERYKGPGDYTGAQIFVGVQDKTNIYRWSSDEVSITVGKGEQFATLPKTKLDPEPLLVECSGPMNDYQCEGRKEATAIEATTTFISGKLTCEKVTVSNEG